LSLPLLEGGSCVPLGPLRGKKPRKTLKYKGGNISVVVGEDIGLEEIMDLDGHVHWLVNLWDALSLWTRSGLGLV
jgi:hypothetical protein